MFPSDPIVEKFAHLLWMFVSSHKYALVVIGLFLWYGTVLHKRFVVRTDKYSETSPPEKDFLRMQCQRWKRHAYQVSGVMLLSIVVAFIIFGFVQMANDVTNRTEYPRSAENASVGPIGYLQILFYVGLISFKARALWDIRSVLIDLERAGL